MKPLSILEIFQPLFVFSEMLGSYPFKTHKTNVTTYRIKQLYSLTCYFTYVTLVILFLIRCLQKYSDLIVVIILIIKCFGSMVVLLAIIVSSHTSHRKILKMMRSISEIDLELKKRFGQEERIARSRYRHRKWLIILILNLMEYFATITYPRIVIINVHIMYCTITIMIEERFKIVNELFHKLDSRSKEFRENVTKLIVIHRVLVKVCQQLNSVYTLQFLLWITQCFILVLNDLYLATYILFFNNYSADFNNTFVYTKNILIYVFDLFYLSKRSATLCFEANRTKRVLLAVRINVNDENERNEVIALVLKLMNRRFEITVGKLFTVDHSLLFSA
ncbi:unnamed protein product, partial [Tenebrio molitor]